MSRYIVLTKVLIKSMNLPFGKDGVKGRARIKMIGLAVLLLVAFLPMAGGIGAIVMAAYHGLAPIGQEGLLLAAGFSVVSMAVLIFSIFYVMSVFYYTRDIESLLPLPLKPSEIMAAKFTVTLLYEYVSEAIILIPVLVGFGISSAAGAVYYAFSLVIFLVVPVIPLIYASILSMLVMRFTNIGRNRDRFRIIGGIIAMFLALGLNFFIQKFTDISMDPNALQALVMQGDNSLLRLMSGIFFSNRFAVMALLESGTFSGLFNLLIYLALAVLLGLLLLIAGEGLYFKGVVGATEVGSGRKRTGNRGYSGGMRQGSPFKAYMAKELKLLFRTPVYFMNCVLMNFLWPLFLLIPILAQGQAESLRELGRFAQSGRGSVILLAVTFAVSLFVSSSNGIAASAISREGKNLYIGKYLPISYGRQIMAKVLSGVLMSLVGTFAMLLAAAFLLGLSLPLLAMILAVSLFGILFSSLSGIFIDLNYPKLVWDNEQKAVKQNLNVVACMLLSIVFAAISALGVIFSGLPLFSAFAVLLLVFAVLDLLLYYLVMKAGVRLLSNMEA